MANSSQPARILYRLGVALQQQGNLDGARQRLEEALAVADAAYGPGDIIYGVTLLALGDLDRKQHPDVAMARIAHAVAVVVAARGPDHPDSGRAMGDLGALYALQDDPLRARRWLRRALPIVEKARGWGHPQVAFLKLGLEGVSLGQRPERMDEWSARMSKMLDSIYDKRGLHADHMTDAARRMRDRLGSLDLPAAEINRKIEDVPRYLRVVSMLRWMRVLGRTATAGLAIPGAHAAALLWYAAHAASREEFVAHPLAQRPALTFTIVYSIVLLALLATGGGLSLSALRTIRTLQRDEADQEPEPADPATLTTESILDDVLAIFDEIASKPGHGRLPARRARADTYWELSRPDQALTDYNFVLRRRPNDASALRARACVKMMLERHRSAAADLARALKIEPESAFALHRYGLALNALERHEEATEVFTQALRIDPDNALLWQGRGLALVGLDHDEEARRDLERATELDPDDEETRTALLRLDRPAMRIASNEPLLDAELTSVVSDALIVAASLTAPGRPLDTRLMLHALMTMDARNTAWERICRDYADAATVLGTAADDPDLASGGTWNLVQLTATATVALHTAARIADQHNLWPLPPGVLALGLVANPQSAAARALRVHSGADHRDLVAVIKKDLLRQDLYDL